MTATDELRRLLDEREVEWKEHRHVMPGSMAIQRETLWGQPTDVASGKPIPHVYHYRATEMGDGRLFLEAQLITPAQAIAVTLGAGTCHNVHEPPKGTTFWPSPHFKCSECGATHVSMEYVFYCPNCGRKVVSNG
jgi:hypothetical protein